MIATSRAVKVGAGLAAIALATTACTSSSSGSSKSTTPAPKSPMSSPMSSGMSSSGSATTVNSATTASSTLQAALDELLVEHVNLTAFAVQTAVQDGITSSQTAAALKALDGNTVALGTAVGSIYGASAKTEFIKLWRAHIGFFVNYTKGLATHNKAMVATAQKDLAGYRASFSKFLGGATGLPAAAISADLQGHVQTLEAAIQAIVGKKSDAAAKLQMAAAHMQGTAAVLAGGIAKQKKLAGSTTSKGAVLRLGLTTLLIQHVAQTGAVVQTAVGTSLTSAQTAGAIKALNVNTQELGTAIGSIYGASAKSEFIKMWDAHIGFFVNYTKGLATKNKTEVATAQKDLAGYRASFSKFLGTATGLPAAAISSDLQGHVQTLEAAIQAIVSKSPSAAAKMSIAESHMAGTAAVLAEGIAAQKHLS